MPQKITKEIITRESIKHKLLLQEQGSFRIFLVCYAMLLLASVPMSILFFFSPSKDLAPRVVFGLLWALMLVTLFITLLRGFQTRKQIQAGGFEVFLARLNYKSEEPLYRRGRQTGYTECFHFEGFGRVENVPHTTYQLADAGETFYLVTLSGSPKVLLYYAEERYEFKELFEK